MGQESHWHAEGLQLRRFGLVLSITLALVSMTRLVGWNGPCVTRRSR
jgi:hypothetical protein